MKKLALLLLALSGLPLLSARAEEVAVFNFRDRRGQDAAQSRDRPG